MKDLKDMTAAELVEALEWCAINTGGPSYKAITAELDARCESWELSISDGGGIVFNDSKHIEIDFAEDVGYLMRIRKPAELHALLGYLLSKEVNNG